MAGHCVVSSPVGFPEKQPLQCPSLGLPSGCILPLIFAKQNSISREIQTMKTNSLSSFWLHHLAQTTTCFALTTIKAVSKRDWFEHILTSPATCPMLLPQLKSIAGVENRGRDCSNSKCHSKHGHQSIGIGVSEPWSETKNSGPLIIYKQHKKVIFYVLNIVADYWYILRRISDATNPKVCPSRCMYIDLFLFREESTQYSFLSSALDSWLKPVYVQHSFSGTDEKKIIEVLSSRTSEERQQIKQKYKALYGKVFQNKWPLSFEQYACW